MLKFTKIKKIITALIVSVAVFFSGQVFLPANFSRVKAEDRTFLYDNVDILDDLQDLDLTQYVCDNTKHPEIIRFMEYCYSEKTSLNDYYSLYFYLYNPSGYPIDTSTVEVNMSLWFNDDGSVRTYGNQHLKFLDNTEDHLLYKFKFSSKTLLQNQRSYHKKFRHRYYEIIGIQYNFLNGTSLDVTDYSISKIYKFSGYSSYCSENNESSLQCILDDSETVKLTLGNTNYRFKNKNIDSYSTGYYLYDNLDTCYFSVPEELFSKYGDINKIKAEWYEYKTEPIYVTSDKGAFDWFSSYLENDLTQITDWGSKKPWRVLYQEELLVDSEILFFGKGLNGEVEVIPRRSRFSLSSNYTDDKCLKYLFYCSDIKKASDYKISRSQMKDWIENYQEKFTDRRWKDDDFINEITDKKYYKGLFTDSIDENRLNLLVDKSKKNGKVVVEIAAGNYNHITQQQEKSWWDLIWTGRDNENINYDTIKTVDTTDYQLLEKESTYQTFCDKYYCNIADIPEIKEAFKKSIDLGNRFILFRFAVTDYYSSSARYDMVGDYIGNSDIPDISGQDGYVGQETVFLNFDVISLTFKNDNQVEKIIGVVASPIDIINGVDPPDDLFVPKEEDWLMKILAIVALILVLVFIGPFISPVLIIIFNLLSKLIGVLLKVLGLIFKFIWSILTFPFRLLKPK